MSYFCMSLKQKNYSMSIFSYVLLDSEVRKNLLDVKSMYGCKKIGESNSVTLFLYCFTIYFKFYFVHTRFIVLYFHNFIFYVTFC
jgi:hypothetical protein